MTDRADAGRASARRMSFGVTFAACAAFWALARYVQLERVGLGFGFDVGLFQHYAQSWGSGQMPYVGFHPEYPPGALLVFLVPWLFGPTSYPEAFAIEMALFDLLALGCVIAWGRRLYGERSFHVPLLGAAYVVLTAALYPVLYTRFDLAPGALVLLATYLAYSGRRAWLGAAVLGVAGAVKLWPFALTPLFCGLALRRKGWRGAFESALALAAGGLLPVAGLLPDAGRRVLEFLDYHAARGIQIESTWATITLVLHAAHLAVAVPVHEFGAFHVRGALGDFFAAGSTKATVALALAPQLGAFFRGGLGARRDTRGEVGLCAACASALGFMVGGKVLSPQYMMWLVPLLVPCIRGPAAAAAALAATVLTTVVYPYLSPALELQAPGHGWALLSVGTRNLLLVAFYVLFLVKSGKRAAAPVTSPHPLPLPESSY